MDLKAHLCCDSMSRVLREAGVWGQNGPATDLRICRGGGGMMVKASGSQTFCFGDSFMLLIVEALNGLLFMWVTSVVFVVLEIKTEKCLEIY